LALVGPVSRFLSGDLAVVGPTAGSPFADGVHPGFKLPVARDRELEDEPQLPLYRACPRASFERQDRGTDLDTGLTGVVEPTEQGFRPVYLESQRNATGNGEGGPLQLAPDRCGNRGAGHLAEVQNGADEACGFLPGGEFFESLISGHGDVGMECAAHSIVSGSEGDGHPKGACRLPSYCRGNCHSRCESGRQGHRRRFVGLFRVGLPIHLVTPGR
jgi:hypothetical protein